MIVLLRKVEEIQVVIQIHNICSANHKYDMMIVPTIMGFFELYGSGFVF